ncbi:Heat shock 70 kDa protein cognate 4 [Hypsibius exemplaris]|uniref:Heat shock 70 kDa protein cognate 4 n=1 Tax=Hypsibius exemplaris TaxID=2072580 RepID=A0A1W0XE73_HYPEX|nr:Heat shock 70 kDa protein cognate 4 [Hypsibius exemplaris]
MAAPAIGIAFGTAYSCVAVFQHGKVDVIANEQGHRITPSCVAFTEDEKLVGDAAKSQITMNPENTIFDMKRLIGRKFADPDFQEDMRHWPFTVLEGDDGVPLVQATLKGVVQSLRPEEICGMVIEEVKRTAEAYLGKIVTEAVIAVPAYFTDVQRQVVRDAGTYAGLKILRVMNEPTAAAMAYGLDKKTEAARNSLIFNLGGSSLDVALLSIEDGIFEVKAVAGDLHLGGEDFDNRLVHFFVQEFEKKHKRDLSRNPRAVRRLRNACELAKRSLSILNQASVEIDSLFEGIDFFTKIIRARLEELCGDLFRTTMVAVEKTLRDAGVEKLAVDDVILAGGSSRIPGIQKLIQEYFDGKELMQSINVDEVVAYGAALQAAVLTGDREGNGDELLSDDMTLLSVGIETAGGLLTPVIDRHVKFPAKGSHMVTTNVDGQTKVVIGVFEGERAMSTDNRFLGKLELSGLEPAPRGAVQVEVVFEISDKLELTVTATEKVSGRSEACTIPLDLQRFEKGELQKMIREADESFESDEVKRDVVERRNALLSFISNVRLVLDEPVFSEKVDDSDRTALTEKCSEAGQWLLDNLESDKIDIEEKQRELGDAFSAVIEKVYTDADQEAFSGLLTVFNSSANVSTKKGKAVA